MLSLYNIGITDEELLELLEQNNKVIKLTEEDLLISINILKNIGCNDIQIKDIIITNPWYLNRSCDDVVNLINKLTEIGIKNLNNLFDNYPLLLNRDDFEIQEFVDKCLKNNMDKNDIVDIVENNLYMIGE